MKRWLRLLGVTAAVAGVTTARDQGEERTSVLTTSGGLRPWAGREAAEVDGDGSTGVSSGGSWSEDDQQDAEITVPTGWEVSEGEGGGEVVIIEEDDVAEGEGLTAVPDAGASLGGDTTSVVDESLSDPPSDPVGAVEETSAPVDGTEVSGDEEESTPSPTVDTVTPTPSAPDDEEELIFDEPTEDTVEPTTPTVTDPTTSSEELNNASSTGSSSETQDTTEAPASSKSSGSSDSAASNLDSLQPESTPPAVDTAALTALETTEPVIVVPSTDEQTSSELPTDTPVPSNETIPVVEDPVTTIPITTDPEVDVVAAEQPAPTEAATSPTSETTGASPTENPVVSDETVAGPDSELIAEEQPAPDASTQSPTETIDVPQAAAVPDVEPVESGGDVAVVEPPASEDATPAPTTTTEDLQTETPTVTDADSGGDFIGEEQPATDGHQTPEPLVDDEMTAEPVVIVEQPASDEDTTAPATTLDGQDQDPAVPEPVTDDPSEAVEPDTIDSSALVVDPPTDAGSSGDVTATDEPAVPPTALSTEPPVPETTAGDGPIKGETSPDDAASASTVEETFEAPAVEATLVPEAEQSPPVAEAIPDLTDPPQAVDLPVSPVDSESPLPSSNTGNESTFSGSSSHPQGLVTDPEPLLPAMEVPGDNSVPSEPTRDDPSPPTEEAPSPVIEDITADAEPAVPVGDLAGGDNNEPPVGTDAPLTTNIEAPVVVVEEPAVNTEAGEQVAGDTESPLLSDATGPGGDVTNPDTLVTDNNGGGEEVIGIPEEVDNNSKKEANEDGDNYTGGADGLVDTNAAPVIPNEVPHAQDGVEASEAVSDPVVLVETSDPVVLVELSTTETTRPATTTDYLVLTTTADVSESQGVAGAGTSQGEAETVRDEDPAISSLLTVEATADEDATAFKVSSPTDNVALVIATASSGSSDRGSTDLRAQLIAATTVSGSSTAEASQSGSKLDESDGALSSDTPASLVTARTTASSGLGTSDTTATTTLVSSAILASDDVKEQSTAVPKSEKPTANVSTDLLTLDTASTSTNLAVETPAEAKLTGSGALLLSEGATTEAYIRGQTSIDSGVVATDSEEEALLANGPGLATDGDEHIIGGRKSRVGSASSGLYGSSSTPQNVVRYAACVASVLSIALLVGFHFVYVDDRLRWPTHSPGTYWSPNAWEFVVYTGYLQQTMALSPMTLMQTPYFLWEFTDIFAWSNLLVYKSPSSSSSAEGGRRLDIIILNSLVGYADRIGTDEASLIFSVDMGFALVLFIFSLLAVALYALDKWRSSRKNSSSSSDGHASLARRLLGLCVLLWFFSLFPLTLVGSFEVAMEVQARLYSSGPLLLAILAVVFVSVGGLAVAARAVFHASSSALRRPKTRALWGGLCEDHTHSARLFFVFTAALQITTGLAIGCVRTGKTLLVLLLVVHGTYLLALFACAPFSSRASLARRFVYAATAAKLLNVVMAFAFLETVPLSVDARCRVARAFIAFNALIIAAWFLRHLVLFCTCVVVVSSRHGDEERGSEEEGERTDVVQLESGGAQERIQVRFGRPSVGPSGSQTTPISCHWQGSTTPSAAIL